eukprot:999803-Prorocentrum_minimum.AAC.1
MEASAGSGSAALMTCGVTWKVVRMAAARVACDKYSAHWATARARASMAAARASVAAAAAASGSSPCRAQRRVRKVGNGTVERLGTGSSK